MMRKEMKVTPSYEKREHGPTHAVGKPLEDVAISISNKVNVKNG